MMSHIKNTITSQNPYSVKQPQTNPMGYLQNPQYSSNPYPSNPYQQQGYQPSPVPVVKKDEKEVVVEEINKKSNLENFIDDS